MNHGKSSPDASGMTSPSVSDIAPSVGVSASSIGADSRQHFAEERDGQSRVSHSMRNRVQRVEASLHLGRRSRTQSFSSTRGTAPT
jgi:hypothetical protein